MAVFKNGTCHLPNDWGNKLKTSLEDRHRVGRKSLWAPACSRISICLSLSVAPGSYQGSTLRHGPPNNSTTMEPHRTKTLAGPGEKKNSRKSMVSNYMKKIPLGYCAPSQKNIFVSSRGRSNTPRRRTSAKSEKPRSCGCSRPKAKGARRQ